MFRCLECGATFDKTSTFLARCLVCGGKLVEALKVEDTVMSEQKVSQQNTQIIQKTKDFLSTRIDTLSKKLIFIVIITAGFVFLWPLYLGGILAFIISRVETEHSWLKFGLIALIVVVSLQSSIERTKDLLGMNRPPEIVILEPAEEKVTVEGIDSIEISGKVNPSGSVVEINDVGVEINKDGSFTTSVPIDKGKNRIQILGKRGSGKTERILEVFRALTEGEKSEAEAERKAQEEAKRKAEEEARARQEKRISDLADIFCETRSKAYSRYVNLDDFSTMLEEAGKEVTLHSVSNRAPSRASCRRVAEQCLKVWSEINCREMAERKIWIGMMEDQLILSLGLPKDQNDTVGTWGIHTQWVYGDFGPYIYLEGKSRDDLVVTSWQD